MPVRTELPPQFGRYRIVQKLGEGGMGAVYLAEDSQLGRRVALKVPHFNEDDGPTVVERFYREARVAAAIEHPNVCPVFDIGQIDGIHYLTMPYIEGAALSRRIHPERPFAPAEAVSLVRKIALAVETLHARGVIHRDLKPGNVLVRLNGEPVVMDFGLARSFSGVDRLTATGATIGTPAYMSPEQLMGEQTTLGPPTDVYSLGVILFELLTGRTPFAGPLHAVYAQILHGTPPAPSQFRPGLAAQLDSICARAMAKDRAERYATMADLVVALGRFVPDSSASPTTAMTTLGLEATDAGPMQQSVQTAVAATSETSAPMLLADPDTRPARTPQGRRWRWPVAATVLMAAASVLIVLLLNGYFDTPPAQEKETSTEDDEVERIEASVKPQVAQSRARYGWSQDGKPTYAYYLWLDAPAHVLDRIRWAAYVFREPDFRPPVRYGTDRTTGFRIDYVGVGVWPLDISIVMELMDGRRATIPFNMLRFSRGEYRP